MEELWLRARELAIEDALAKGKHAEVVGELQQLLVQHPMRESLHAQLMLALYRCDRQADALQAYQDARSYLADELGLEPGERLRTLQAAILPADPALAATSPTAAGDGARQAHAGDANANRRPKGGPRTPLSSCSSRARYAVTLTGPGGVGKTRLALEVAQRAAAALPDGAWLCPARRHAHRARPDPVAHDRGNRRSAPGRAPRRPSSAYLVPGDRQLLVLDNFEHVLRRTPRRRTPGGAVPG